MDLWILNILDTNIKPRDNLTVMNSDKTVIKSICAVLSPPNENQQYIPSQLQLNVMLPGYLEKHIAF